MIVYDLECRGEGHRFEGWFKSSDDFARQQERGLVACPFCGSGDVAKAPQAARLARKGNQKPEPSHPSARSPERQPAPTPREEGEPVAVAPVASHELPQQTVEMIHKLAEMQAKALKASRYVGESFAENARQMHYGEREVEQIHGETTLEDAQELMDEGISVVPLPFPIAPPEETN
ncbi:DUF1178 family protein [Novosphingobium mangrovi (ex Hu et al. 2023)]|uniref:DUF1178 family protein n=1 Tax=Novosphingobium mangrovi (ex Hu et al. 2023) TaxID=2930094 RepID=A0ABT0AAF5_9SPHN|nr:DUF1178 family protein [Novosphingobium mangrovi (ex Hu et al. 2023)]MCJ1960183.1 DUF1178 family protein [Novosphingobium mangrovi (ex Hu et al. 2023)]